MSEDTDQVATNPLPRAEWPCVTWADALAAVPTYAEVRPPSMTDEICDEPVFGELFWETVEKETAA